MTELDTIAKRLRDGAQSADGAGDNAPAGPDPSGPSRAAPWRE
jgi:hypothetical protein